MTPRAVLRVREIAAWLSAPYEGDGAAEIWGVAPIEAAGPGDITFVANQAAAKQANTAAACVIVPLDFPNEPRRTVIRVPSPRAAIAKVIHRLHPKMEPPPGIHPTAVLGPGVEISVGVTVGPHASLGAGVRVGAGSRIGAGCVIGDYSKIGDHCILHANVTIYHDVTIGHRTILHSGSVIGADGFGFVASEKGYEKFPQVGRVEIGNDVEIGANSCVDRAALGVTTIGDGTKLDNMVHVGHNCRLGKHVVVAAQTGLSGGVTIGDFAVVGGQVGVGDKARIEPRAVIGSGSGILTSKIVRAGEVMWGTPARPLKEHLQQLAVMGKLPELMKELKELTRQLKKTKEQASGG